MNLNEQLLKAVYARDLAAVRHLLASGADINYAEGEGNTPLLCAVFLKHIEVAKALITAGADVNKANETGTTPLQWIATCGNAEMVKILIEAGAEINKINKYGKSPLRMASSNRHTEAVAALLDAGADIKADTDGKTAFDVTNSPEILKLLTTYAQARATRAAWELDESNRIADNPNGVFYTHNIQWLPREMVDMLEATMTEPLQMTRRSSKG